MEKYNIVKKLGKGCFNKVYLINDKEDKNKLYAVKISEENPHNLKMAENEHIFLNEFQHPNLLRSVEYFIDKGKIYLIQEYFEGKSCFSLINQELDGEFLKKIVRQLIDVIEYIHKLGYVNSDISLDNLLINEEGLIKMIDFGHIQKMNSDNIIPGKIMYHAPEIIKEKKYFYTTDYWSLGIVCFLLFTGDFPFKGTQQFTLFPRILNTKIDYLTYPNLNKSKKKFLKNLLKKNPQNRKILKELIDKF